MRAPRGVKRHPDARVARSVVFETGPDARIILGPTAVVGAGCRLRAGAGALIRVDGSLGEDCRLSAREAITVAQGASLGPGCVCVDWDLVSQEVERPMREQGVRTGAVHVGLDAHLGPGVAVLRGVRIGAGAVVLAHSVCTREVVAGREVGGTPARPSRRSKDHAVTDR